MTMCKDQIAALIECARSGRNPDAALGAHLSACAACEERWHDELALTEQFRDMRAQALAAGAASQSRRDLRAAALMRHISRPVSVMPSRSWNPAWALTAAAAVLLAVGVGYGVGARTRHRVAQPAIRTHGVRNSETVIYEVSADSSSDDFIPVPYALPLVPGEIVDLEHSDLGPQDLASMGLTGIGLTSLGIDDDDSGNISADVVVGQDGFPRAIRITDGNTETQF